MRPTSGSRNNYRRIRHLHFDTWPSFVAGVFYNYFLGAFVQPLACRVLRGLGRREELFWNSAYLCCSEERKGKELNGKVSGENACERWPHGAGARPAGCDASWGLVCVSVSSLVSGDKNSAHGKEAKVGLSTEPPCLPHCWASHALTAPVT